MSSALRTAIPLTKLEKSPLPIKLLPEFEVRYDPLHGHPWWLRQLHLSTEQERVSDCDVPLRDGPQDRFHVS